ncbi:MAG: two-component system, response regulator YesN [Clostridiales bacterium]|jgi:two-component system response regulator YesN|nr:two-component system, response regulator YesN [Clostridiales bacterium]
MYKILIVDDEYLERQALRMILEEIPSVEQVFEAENGLSALEVVKANTLDLVFMDIKMPKMDGLEASRLIRQEYPKLKIVILTAYADFELAQKAVKIHADDYLLKPSRPEKIEEALTLIEDKSANEVVDYMISFKRALFKGQLKDTRFCLKNLFKTDQDHMDDIELLKSILVTVQQASDFFGITLDEKSKQDLQAVKLQGMRMKDYLTLIDLLLDKIFHQVIEKKLGSYDREIDYALNFIEYHLTGLCTLECVADYMNISPHYFSKLFKNEVGENFIQYITNRKMEIASEKLIATKDPIVSIAFDLGFNEANYFSKVFKKSTGYSPSEFREVHIHKAKQEKILFEKYYSLSNARWVI